MKVKRTEYSSVRGFNYQPGYASHGIGIWVYAFDAETIDRELGYGKKHFPAINTIRLWLSHEAYLVDPARFTANFERVLSLAGKHGVRFIPTLFNGCESAMPPFTSLTVSQISYWCSKEELYRQLILRYLQDIAGGHADDPRILMWDLFNEPFAFPEENRYRFVKRIYGDMKKLGLKAPLTAGSCPVMTGLRLLEEVSDVMTFHPYYARNAWIAAVGEFTAFLDEAVAFANKVGKPLLATETGWGALDDELRADTLSVELSEITRRGLGFLIHMLCHSPVFDGHRPEFGPISEAGYMACVESNGELRKHHEIINRFMTI